MGYFESPFYTTTTPEAFWCGGSSYLLPSVNALAPHELDNQKATYLNHTQFSVGIP